MVDRQELLDHQLRVGQAGLVQQRNPERDVVVRRIARRVMADPADDRVVFDRQPHRAIGQRQGFERRAVKRRHHQIALDLAVDRAQQPEREAVGERARQRRPVRAETRRHPEQRRQPAADAARQLADRLGRIERRRDERRPVVVVGRRHRVYIEHIVGAAVRRAGQRFPLRSNGVVAVEGRRHAAVRLHRLVQIERKRRNVRSRRRIHRHARPVVLEHDPIADVLGGAGRRVAVAIGERHRHLHRPVGQRHRFVVAAREGRVQQRQILRREHLARRRIDRDRKGDQPRRVRRVGPPTLGPDPAHHQRRQHLVQEDLRPLGRRHAREAIVRHQQRVGRGRRRRRAIGAEAAAHRRHQRRARARIADHRIGAARVVRKNMGIVAGFERIKAGEQAPHRRAARPAEERRAQYVVVVRVARRVRRGWRRRRVLQSRRLVVHHVNLVPSKRRRRRTVVLDVHRDGGRRRVEIGVGHDVGHRQRAAAQALVVRAGGAVARRRALDRHVLDEGEFARRGVDVHRERDAGVGRPDGIPGHPEDQVRVRHHIGDRQVALRGREAGGAAGDDAGAERHAQESVAAVGEGRRRPRRPDGRRKHHERGRRRIGHQPGRHRDVVFRRTLETRRLVMHHRRVFGARQVVRPKRHVVRRDGHGRVVGDDVGAVGLAAAVGRRFLGARRRREGRRALEGLRRGHVEGDVEARDAARSRRHGEHDLAGAAVIGVVEPVLGAGGAQRRREPGRELNRDRVRLRPVGEIAEGRRHVNRAVLARREDFAAAFAVRVDRHAGRLVGDGVDRDEDRAGERRGRQRVGVDDVGQDVQGDVAIVVGRRDVGEQAVVQQIGGQVGTGDHQVGAAVDEHVAVEHDLGAERDAAGQDGDAGQFLVVGRGEHDLQHDRIDRVVAEMLVRLRVLVAAAEFAAAVRIAVRRRLLGRRLLARRQGALRVEAGDEEGRFRKFHAVIQRRRVDRAVRVRHARWRVAGERAERGLLVGRHGARDRPGGGVAGRRRAGGGGHRLLQRHAQGDQVIHRVERLAVGAEERNRRARQDRVHQPFDHHDAAVRRRDLGVAADNDDICGIEREGEVQRLSVERNRHPLARPRHGDRVRAVGLGELHCPWAVGRGPRRILAATIALRRGETVAGGGIHGHFPVTPRFPGVPPGRLPASLESATNSSRMQTAE